MHIYQPLPLMFFAALWGFGSIALAADPNSESARIVHPTPAAEGEFPWQVYLRMEHPNASWYVYCGGSLIAPQWVLTAGHCMYESQEAGAAQWTADEIEVGYGSVDFRRTTRVSVAKTFVDSQYQECRKRKDTCKRDIALLKLKEPIEGGKTIKYDSPLDDVLIRASDYTLIVTGWGTLWSGGDLAPVRLGKAELKYTSDQICKEKMDADIQVEFCASAEHKDSCQGDSGGPVTAIMGEQVIQVGVVSWGFGCASDTPGVYTRVSYFADWIGKTMQDNGSETAGIRETP